ncbi:MAG: hypothetical protein MJ071_00615 [Oscillospiraceae bacterium]|nr:hypothetical protein [Oscillospiraceae bacterium]
MASARNIVLAGNFTGCRLFRMPGGIAYISGTMKKMDDIYLTPAYVSDYQVMLEDEIRSGRSVYLTGILDPGRLLELSFRASEAYQKKGIYTVLIQFKDYKRVLVEMDSKILEALEYRMRAEK